MPSLIQGRIVYCKVGVCDPQGNNPKPNRPFVVITHDDDIKAHERIQAVGITDELSLSPADHYLELPSGSGCTPGSAALCTWIVRLNKADLDVPAATTIEVAYANASGNAVRALGRDLGRALQTYLTLLR